MRCQFILNHSDPSVPVKPEDCCPEEAVDAEPSSGRWYCRRHLDKRKTDPVAATNGDGHTWAKLG
jgi:hypothetical protein